MSISLTGSKIENTCRLTNILLRSSPAMLESSCFLLPLCSLNTLEKVKKPLSSFQSYLIP